MLTDPPYGNGTDYQSYSDTPENLAGLIASAFPLFRYVSDVSLITPGIANVWKWPQSDWILAWYSPAGESASKWGFGCWQPVLAYGKNPYLARGLGRRPDAFVFDRPSPKYGHPCSKPIEVISRLIQLGSISGTILDPFMGSGTTLRAAKDLGRKAIGIEIEERYCEIAARRMEQEVLPLNDASNLNREVADTASLFQ